MSGTRLEHTAAFTNQNTFEALNVYGSEHE